MMMTMIVLNKLINSSISAWCPLQTNDCGCQSTSHKRN